MYIHRIAENLVRSRLDDSKIIMLLGPRQVGKTTLIESIVREKNGILLNCDIAVDKARLLASGTLAPDHAVQSLGNPALLVIDEAQNLPEIARIVKGWYDAHVATKIVLLGSSSLNLLDQAAEPLTGRNEKIYLTPLLFGEIIRSQPWFSQDLSKAIVQEQFSDQLQTLMLNHVVYGGYPEAVITSDKERYLLNLTSDYLLRDVIHGGLIKSPETVKKLLTLLAHQTGNEVSVNELAGNLHSSRQTVEKYLELLERSYVIFRIQAFSTNQRKEIAKNNKIFFWDTGVRNALLKEFSLSPLRSDIGLLFENWVMSEVSKLNLITGEKNSIYFWRKRDGSEVDLVIKGTNRFKAYEIKWTKQTPTASSKSFTNSYNIPVEVVTKDTVFELVNGHLISSNS